MKLKLQKLDHKIHFSFERTSLLNILSSLIKILNVFFFERFLPELLAIIFSAIALFQISRAFACNRWASFLHLSLFRPQFGPVGTSFWKESNTSIPKAIRLPALRLTDTLSDWLSDRLADRLRTPKRRVNSSLEHNGSSSYRQFTPVVADRH